MLYAGSRIFSLNLRPCRIISPNLIPHTYTEGVGNGVGGTPVGGRGIDRGGKATDDSTASYVAGQN